MKNDKQESADKIVGSTDGLEGKTGWWNPDPYSMRRRSVFHYVGTDGRTLCMKWAYMGLGTVEEGMDDHFENCAACKKKKAKMPSNAVLSGAAKGD